MRILITGDYCPIGRNGELIKQGNYAALFNGYDKITNMADYSVVNFECPFTYVSSPIVKEGPAIKVSDKNVFEALKYCNFNLLTLANNHIKDYGGRGVLDTIKEATKFGFKTVGAGKDISEASKPHITEIKGHTLAFINIAENEFNGASYNQPGAYGLDLVENSYLIKEVRSKVDYLIVIYHGGREHFQLPTPEMRKRLRFFINCGADAVVSHHTHCYSGYEYYNNGLIVYGLGNFIFDYKKKYQTGRWTEGASALLTLKNNRFVVELIPHVQGRVEDCSLKLLEGNALSKFQEKISEINSILNDDEKYALKWEDYLESQKKTYLSSLFIPFFYLRAFFILGIFPINLLIRKNTKTLLHYIRCETHNEISKEILARVNENYNRKLNDKGRNL